jgi:(1->4)-alpha-D-glucan 1-alpha-D-glucosylmutase
VTVTPRSTYRLQLTADFTLHDAAALAGYLRELGVDWFYLSPVLQSAAGSTHGYDVVDHGRVDAARGGQEGLDALGAAAHAAGMGVLVDIVPNHMGVGDPAENAWWRDVLASGRSSKWADYFDIDWDAGGGQLRLGSDLNYRRFFAIDSLAGLRVELPEVFAATHRLIIDWVRGGLGAGVPVGLRVDHPDGLADPGGYLDTLAGATGGAYVVVEKILQQGEDLPPWLVAGSTGYDALADIDRVIVDPDGRDELVALDASLRPAGPLAWSDLTHDTRRAVADGMLHPEVRRLARDVLRVEERAEGTRLETEDALAELLAAFPVYRTYLPVGAEHLAVAVAAATTRRPDLAGALDELARKLGNPHHPAAIRFQQTSGMVMAKGVEDTAFYRDSRLATLTEVGGDPDHFATTVDEFHAAQAARLTAHPECLTTLTTHDTKRSEDTRARISVLAELSDEWAAFVGRRVGSPLDGALENLLWQSIAGCWPREREALHEYAVKAAREANGRTSWADPDAAFEDRLRELVDTAFDDAETTADVAALVARITPPGWSNALGAKLLQLTGPGVPDVYQGSELWDFSLVDPDNRRPVDYDLRRRMLAELDREPPPIDATGAAKLLVTSRALRARRDRPELFTGYTPLAATGPASDHVIAADRGGAIPVATRLPVRLSSAGGWRGTTIALPSGPFRDVLTGEPYPGGVTSIADLLDRYPVALLLPD